MPTVFDPLRGKEVALTPEEKVRQGFISFLRDECAVPLSLMNSEVSFTYGQKHFRADILVFDRKGAPLMVVECKNEDVPLSSLTVRQALRYHAALNVSYIAITNGKLCHVYGKDPGGKFLPLNHIPHYEEMLR